MGYLINNLTNDVRTNVQVFGGKELDPYFKTTAQFINKSSQLYFHNKSGI